MSKWRRLWHTVQQDTYHIKKKKLSKKGRNGIQFNCQRHKYQTDDSSRSSPIETPEGAKVDVSQSLLPRMSGTPTHKSIMKKKNKKLRARGARIENENARKEKEKDEERIVRRDILGGGYQNKGFPQNPSAPSH